MKGMKESIEVIERDENGQETGRFYFWGKLTIQPSGGDTPGDRGTISINAPGHHEQADFPELGKQAAIEDEDCDKPPFYCRLHGMTGHTEGSPMCENITKRDTDEFNNGLAAAEQEPHVKP